MGGKADEDKIKMLRKKNAELTTLTKELDDKVKALGVEKEQLVRIMCCQSVHRWGLSYC